MNLIIDNKKMKNNFLSVGLEEEYLVVNKYNGELIVDPPKGLMRDCKKKT